MHTFKLKILTPDEKLFDGLVLSVNVPTQAGVITILKNHAPLISNLSIGQLKIIDDKNIEHDFLLQGGILDVKNSHTVSEVIILADLKLDKDFPLQNLDKEIARAKEIMSLNKSDIDFAELESELERNIYLKRFQTKN